MRETSFRNKMLHRLYVAYIALVLFSLVGSTLSTALHVSPGPIAPLAAFCLIVSGASCISIEIRDRKSVGYAAAIASLSEILALWTGFPFGRYEYTGDWWPSVPLGQSHSFPLLLPFSWILIAGGSFLVVRRYLTDWRGPIVSAALATIIDAPMEKAMCKVFHYWIWNRPGPLFGAPWTNSAGWFLVSLVICSLFHVMADPVRSSRNGPHILSIFCLFVAFAGAITGFDRAWVCLGAIGIAIWASILPHRATGNRMPEAVKS